MSLNMLDYIDDAERRSHIRKTLNRIEAYHQLRRAIAKVHGGSFRGGSSLEIRIWNQCARLMANCIILYNAIILSELLTSYKGDEAELVRRTLALVSPVSWIHINMNGRYDFRKTAPLDIAPMVRILQNCLNLAI